MFTNNNFSKNTLALSITLSLVFFQTATIERVHAEDNHDDHQHEVVSEHKVQAKHNHEHKADEKHAEHNDEHNDPAVNNHDEHDHTDEEQAHTDDYDEYGARNSHDAHNEVDDHGHEHGDEEHEEGFVKMTVEQQKMAGIQVEPVAFQSNINQIITAPGEVVNDLYKTTLLTTQVDSKVLERKVVLGQHVKKGNVIAVLYSLDIATAQSQFKVALSEWNRVRKLGKQTVGAKRYNEAKADYETNKALLLAYGFNEQLIGDLIAGKNQYQPGAYPVIAPHDGVIMEDNFQSGQYLPVGSTIARLVDESDVWVDALLAPEIGQKIPVGTKARVEIGNKLFPARVIHDSHTIDEVTRTRKLRLIIQNHDHVLHAGLFAKVFLELPLKHKVILLPESALMRSADGDWTVFIEQEPGVFKQEEVQLVNTINGRHQIKGLNSGKRIAVKGAFFLASEMAKGGFDPHNH